MFDLTKYRFDKSKIAKVFDSFENKLSNTIGTGFRTDIINNSDSYFLTAELPGFERSDISIDITDHILSIKAKHADSIDRKNSDGEIIRRERSYRSYSRSFDISDVDSEAISADYRNGIL